MATNDEQDTPVMDEGGSDSTDSQKIGGILKQVQADAGLQPGADPVALLAGRLHDAGIRLSEAEIVALARGL